MGLHATSLDYSYPALFKPMETMYGYIQCERNGLTKEPIFYPSVPLPPTLTKIKNHLHLNLSHGLNPKPIISLFCSQIYAYWFKKKKSLLYVQVTLGSFCCCTRDDPERSFFFFKELTIIPSTIADFF